MLKNLDELVRSMAKAVGSDPDAPAGTQEALRMKDRPMNQMEARPTNPNGYAILRKCGSLRSGYEHSNSLWHAVKDGEGAALCGTRPAIGWRSGYVAAKPTVTCKRCQSVLNEWPKAELDEDAAPSAAF